MKKLVFRAAHYSGLNYLLRHLKAGPTILFYHGVEKKIVDSRVQRLHLPLPVFEQQIAYLRKHFEIVSIDDVYRDVAEHRKPDASKVVLTFDDGYKNNLTTVAPFLKAEGIPFSVFISTRHINEDIRFPTYYLRAALHYTDRKQVRISNSDYDLTSEDRKRSALAALSGKLKTSPKNEVDRIIADLIALLPETQWSELNGKFESDAPMNWDEVRALFDQGVIIGSHCHDHMLLHEKQDLDEIDRQLRTSRELIARHTGECRYIAYPNGTTSDIFPAALSRVRAQQYVAGLTTVSGEVESDANPLLLPRIGTWTRDIHEFRFIVNGSYRHNKANHDWYRGYSMKTASSSNV